MQGPWSPALRDYLVKHHRAYDALIFFTYLYAPTVLGLRIDPGRSILVPTAHDEPAIHLGIYKEMFRLPAAIAYNTEVEREFLKTRFEIAAAAEEVVGCGVDLMPGGDAAGRPPAREDRPRSAACPRRSPSAMALDEPGTPRTTTTAASVPPHLTHRGARFQRRHRLLRPVPALRRPHRPRQGLRGTARVLHQLQGTGRRRRPGADGRRS